MATRFSKGTFKARVRPRDGTEVKEVTRVMVYAYTEVRQKLIWLSNGEREEAPSYSVPRSTAVRASL